MCVRCVCGACAVRKDSGQKIVSKDRLRRQRGGRGHVDAVASGGLSVGVLPRGYDCRAVELGEEGVRCHTSCARGGAVGAAQLDHARETRDVCVSCRVGAWGCSIQLAHNHVIHLTTVRTFPCLPVCALRGFVLVEVVAGGFLRRPAVEVECVGGKISKPGEWKWSYMIRVRARVVGISCNYIVYQCGDGARERKEVAEKAEQFRPYGQ